MPTTSVIASGPRAETRAERLALDERHRVEGQPVGVARREHRDDVRLLQRGDRADLALEALRAEPERQIGRQHLHDDLALRAAAPRRRTRGSCRRRRARAPGGRRHRAISGAGLAGPRASDDVSRGARGRRRARCAPIWERRAGGVRDGPPRFPSCRRSHRSLHSSDSHSRLHALVPSFDPVRGRHAPLPGDPLSAQVATAPLGFSDPQRVARLSSTFGDIDRAFREHAEREHIPGAVWAIVIDGTRRAHRRDRLSRRRVEVARRQRHRVPHRLDDEELHGDVDPQAARRGQALARRSGREVRARARRR